MLVHAPIIGRLRHRPRRWASRRIARGDYGPVIRRGTGSRFPGAKPPSLSLYSLPQTGMAYQQCSNERSEGTRIIRAPSSQLPDYLSQNHFGLQIPTPPKWHVWPNNSIRPLERLQHNVVFEPSLSSAQNFHTSPARSSRKTCSGSTS
jgi:hypothetical protein